MIKLKPCHACGGEAIFRYYPGRRFGYYVECDQCHVQSIGVFENKDAAAEEWNKRFNELNSCELEHLLRIVKIYAKETEVPRYRRITDSIYKKLREKYL